MRKNRLLALALLLPLLSFGQDSTHKITLLDGKVEFMISNRMQPMSDEVFKKLIGTNRPILMMSDSASAITFFVDQTSMPATDDQMAAFALYQYQDLRKKYPDTEFPPHPHGTVTVNGKKLAFLKFVSHYYGYPGFTTSYFASVDGKILGFSLNCHQPRQSTAEPIMENLIKTLKIK